MRRPSVLDRAKGALIGLAVGDALGTAIEFQARDTYEHVTDMMGGGAFNLPAGYWTDDTSMALCLGDSLLERGFFHAGDLLDKFTKWREEGYNSSTGESFDIGITTRTALDQYKVDGYPSAGPSDIAATGNGSIMRLAPAVLFSLNDRGRAMELSEMQSRVTHAAPEVLEACRLMAAMMHDHIHGRAWPVLGLQEPKILALANGEYRNKKRSNIKSSGYVVDTLEAALWAVHKTGNFKDAVLLAVNLGDDADTVGAVAGQLAGAKYGYDAIPKDWADKILWKEKIEKMAVSLAENGLKPALLATPRLTP